MRTGVANPHRQLLGVLTGDTAAARGRHLTPVVDIVLLEQPSSTVIRLAAGPDDVLDRLWSVLLNEHEVPKFRLQRTSRECQPEPQDPVREEAVVAQLDPARAERSQAPLNLRKGSIVVLLENVESVTRHAVHIPGGVVVYFPKGEGVAIDEDVPV